MVIFPLSVKLNCPLLARGRVSPLTLVGTSSAFGNRRTARVSCLTKLSLADSSLRSVPRSNEIFESGENVPLSFSTNVPAAPVATSTASEGKLTPTSCSRTRTVACDLSVTVQAGPATERVAATMAVGAAVGVAICAAAGAGDAAVPVAPPQAAAISIDNPSGPARRGDTRAVIAHELLFPMDG